MFEPSRAAILSRTQRLIHMGEWLERNEEILATLIEDLSDAVDLHMDGELDSFIENEFHRLSAALSSCICNLVDHKDALNPSDHSMKLILRHPRHTRCIKSLTVVLDEQQSQESTKS